MKWLAALPFLVVALALPHRACAQTSDNAMYKIYGDESHCLTAPEIRGEKDKRYSCYCRDALADAAYVYRTYIITGKDRNLNGAYLGLEWYAEEKCGDDLEESLGIFGATQDAHWKWNGPEVTRTYPPVAEIRKMKPDSRGWISVKFLYQLTFRDAQGHVTKVEQLVGVEDEPADVWFQTAAPARDHHKTSIKP
jgi:hypothetical protein